MALPEYLLSRETLEQVSRQNVQAFPIDPNRALVRMLGIWKLFVDPQEITVASHLLLEGFWESWITVFMAREIKPGDFCLDVGALFGYFTILMGAATGPEGRVVAVEPNPAAANLVRDSINLNGLGGWTTLDPRIAAQTEGAATLIVDRQYAGGASATGAVADYGRPQIAHRLPTVSIDTLVADWPRLDFVKIDAEGLEWEILRGMRQTLARFPNVRLMVEYEQSRFGGQHHVFFQELQDAGFVVRYVDVTGTAVPVDGPDHLPVGALEMLYLSRQ